MGDGDDPNRTSRCCEGGVIPIAQHPVFLDVSKSAFRCVKLSPMSDHGISRRRLLGGAAAAAAPAAIGLSGLLNGRGPESALAEPPAPTGHAGHGEFPHATFAAGTTVDHGANGFH